MRLSLPEGARALASEVLVGGVRMLAEARALASEVLVGGVRMLAGGGVAGSVCFPRQP